MLPQTSLMKRKQAIQLSAAASLPLLTLNAEKKQEAFKLNYILASAMYGTMPLDTILAESKKSNAHAIDIWPKVHGDQREQAAKMGNEAFKALLKKHGIKMRAIACYKLGPYGLQKEMKYAQDINGKGVTLICTGRGAWKNKKGEAMKTEVKKFVEKLKPHIAAAEKYGATIAIENHSHNLIHTKDSILWFSEMTQFSDAVGIAYAPHHLEKANLTADQMGQLIIDIKDKVKYVYAQQYGMGSRVKLPKEQELLQMPGRGKLDFTPLLKGLKKVNYQGHTSIFMHPVPRGIPILNTATEITAEINRSRKYLDGILQSLT